MIRVMYDSDNSSSIKPGAAIVALYSDLVTNLATEQKKHAPAQVVLIDRGLGDPTGKASIADIESGALTPSQAAAWYDRKSRAGIGYLTTYCNRSTLPAVNAAMGKRNFWRWVATLDGTLHIAGHRPGLGPAAVQFASATMAGFHADVSLVFEDGWHPSPASGNQWVPAVLTQAKELSSQAGVVVNQAGALVRQLEAHQ